MDKFVIKGGKPNVENASEGTSLCCYSFRAEFHKIGQLPTASGVLLMVSRIIYLFQ